MITNIESSIPKALTVIANTSQIADEIYREIVNTAQNDDKVRQIFDELAARLENIESRIGSTWQMTTNSWPKFANVSL